jgi:predicted GNAT family N-acyltransferase
VIVREARPDERDAVLALRRAVFVDEQGIAAAGAIDAEDDTCTHLVATIAEEIVGVCRLVPGNHRPPARLRLGYLAVVPWARGRGVATALLTDAAARALAGGFATVLLYSRPETLGLYERAGYERRGSRIVIGIEHHVMELRVG